jgi:DNA-binding response OmpR family regulator
MRKVMVVDDDKEFLDEINEMLNLSGYETILLSDSRYAFMEVCKVKPDVILLDLKMDGVNGFELADELRSSPETKFIPVIGITGFYTEKEHQLLMRVCGIKQCLIKPFNPLDVIAAIERGARDNKAEQDKGQWDKK